MGLNVAQLVLERARLRPASPAIITQEQVITYGRLGVAVGVVARHLREHGVTPGQIVGVSMGQNALHVITLLAIAQIGAVSLPLHTAVPAERRLLAAKRFGAATIVSGRDDMALTGLAFISLANVSFDGSSIPPDSEIHAVDADTLFRIALSSGTSADPKGMMFTHRLWISRTNRPEHDFSLHSRTLPMDLNFSIGLRPALSALVKGASIVLPPSTNSDHLLHAMVSHQVTHIMLSPNQALGLVDQFATEGIHCPGLVRLTIAGGRLTPELLRGLRSRLSPNVHVIYASTESGALAFASPEILDQHPESAGRVEPWARIEIVDDKEQPLPANETGLLRVRSEDQVSGYYRDDDQTRKHFRDGWFYPGDLGRFDDEGLLYIEGRTDDQLNVGGLKINPEDIDSVLAEYSNVVEAGAFILTGEEGVEILAAAIVLRDGNSIDGLQAHALAKLGPLAPTKYIVVPSLPRTINGKLRRGELAAQFSRPAEI